MQPPERIARKLEVGRKRKLSESMETIVLSSDDTDETDMVSKLSQSLRLSTYIDKGKAIYRKSHPSQPVEETIRTEGEPSSRAFVRCLQTR